MAITQRERQELTDKVRNVYPHSFVEFAGDMWVPLGGNVGRFRDAWVEPQQRIINALSPSLVANANGQIPPIGRFWLEMTKGFGKDLGTLTKPL